MTLNRQEIQAHLEKKQRELQEDIARIQERYPLPSMSPLSTEEVEERGEAARELEERENAFSLLRTHQRLLGQVEQALHRLEEGSYGLCSVCGQPIAEGRLQALPWATRDVACEEKMTSRS